MKTRASAVAAALLLFSVGSQGSCGDVWNPETYSLGAGFWAGYSGGHFQEAIYSTPTTGFSGGGDLFALWVPIDFGFAHIGVRGTLLETNYVPLETFRLIQLDLNADLYADIEFFGRATLYGFAGATVNILNVKEKGAEEDAAEYGKGFRYGGGGKIRIDLRGGPSIRVGPEFVMGHAIYTYIIYHYRRINLSCEFLFE